MVGLVARVGKNEKLKHGGKKLHRSVALMGII